MVLAIMAGCANCGQSVYEEIDTTDLAGGPNEVIVIHCKTCQKDQAFLDLCLQGQTVEMEEFFDRR